eukprot:scaffold1881_cov169-Amphora_coffeaeformis.AAC.3
MNHPRGRCRNGFLQGIPSKSIVVIQRLCRGNGPKGHIIVIVTISRTICQTTRIFDDFEQDGVFLRGGQCGTGQQ